MSNNKTMQADVKLFYNTDLARFSFDENFVKYESSKELWYFINYGNIEMKPLDELIVIYRNTSREKLLNLLGWEKDEAKEYSRDELIGEVYYFIDDITDLEDELIRYNIGYNKKFKTYITKGYSQGDYAEVIVPDEVYSDGIQQLIDNYFWDLPINVNITLFAGHEFNFDDGEIDIPEYFNYPYDIDSCKEDVKKYLQKRFEFAAAKDKIIRIILDSFPNEIKY